MQSSTAPEELLLVAARNTHTADKNAAVHAWSSSGQLYFVRERHHTSSSSCNRWEVVETVEALLTSSTSA